MILKETVANEQPARKPLILIVDDVPKNLQVLGTFLRRKGFRVSLHTEGARALEMVHTVQPDLVLLDIMMPNMNGFEVCQKLKESPLTRDVPIIFLTAKTSEEDLVKGFETGAVDYVTKPFRSAELLARVETHLKLKQAREEIIQLEQKNSVLAMVVTANHEINQPLTVLKGYLQLYRESFPEGKLSKKQKDFLEKMGESVNKIDSILIKFRNAGHIRFEDYSEFTKMVVFDEEEKKNSK